MSHCFTTRKRRRDAERYAELESRRTGNGAMSRAERAELRELAESLKGKIIGTPSPKRGPSPF